MSLDPTILFGKWTAEEMQHHATRATVFAYMAGREELAGAGGELAYGKGLFLGRSKCLKEIWKACARMVHRWTGNKPRAKCVRLEVVR